MQGNLAAADALMGIFGLKREEVRVIEGYKGAARSLCRRMFRYGCDPQRTAAEHARIVYANFSDFCTLEECVKWTRL